MCTLLNTHNSGELTVPGVSREASRFRAGVSLCAVLMDSHELKNWECFTARTDAAETQVFCLCPFFLIYCDFYTVGEKVHGCLFLITAFQMWILQAMMMM